MNRVFKGEHIEVLLVLFCLKLTKGQWQSSRCLQLKVIESNKVNGTKQRVVQQILVSSTTTGGWTIETTINMIDNNISATAGYNGDDNIEGARGVDPSGINSVNTICGSLEESTSTLASAVFEGEHSEPGGGY